MPEPKLKLLKSFPSVLVIDEQKIDVRVKRLTNREFDEFSLMFARFGEDKPDDPTITAAAKAEAEEANRVWMRAALDGYMTIAPGQIDNAGEDVTKGGDLVDLFGGRMDVAPQALALILFENKVPEKKKESLRLLLASSLGLVQAAASAATGSAPAPTAEGAEPPISAPAEAVSLESQSGELCGTAAHSS